MTAKLLGYIDPKNRPYKYVYAVEQEESDRVSPEGDPCKGYKPKIDKPKKRFILIVPPFLEFPEGRTTGYLWTDDKQNSPNVELLAEDQYEGEINLPEVS